MPGGATACAPATLHRAASEYSGPAIDEGVDEGVDDSVACSGARHWAHASATAPVANHARNRRDVGRELTTRVLCRGDISTSLDASTVRCQASPGTRGA
jgi:hypothetical protein